MKRDEGLMNTPTAIATQAYWKINKCWLGHGKCTVGHALKTLNGAKSSVGPQRDIYWKIEKLIQDIVHKQAEPANHQQQAS
jgi:hypothetical protein